MSDRRAPAARRVLLAVLSEIQAIRHARSHGPQRLAGYAISSVTNLLNFR
jgi:hypothetical protein